MSCAAQVCSNGYGSCSAGTDLTMCGAALEYMCGTAYVAKQMLLDQCGGHASPYHYHSGAHWPPAPASVHLAALRPELRIRIQ